MVEVLQMGKVLLNQSDYLIGAEEIDVFSGVSKGSVWINVKHPEGMGFLWESFPLFDTSQC